MKKNPFVIFKIFEIFFLIENYENITLLKLQILFQ